MMAYCGPGQRFATRWVGRLFNSRLPGQWKSVGRKTNVEIHFVTAPVVIRPQAVDFSFSSFVFNPYLRNLSKVVELEKLMSSRKPQKNPRRARFLKSSQALVFLGVVIVWLRDRSSSEKINRYRRTRRDVSNKGIRKILFVTMIFPRTPVAFT